MTNTAKKNDHDRHVKVRTPVDDASVDWLSGPTSTQQMQAPTLRTQEGFAPHKRDSRRLFLLERTFEHHKAEREAWISCDMRLLFLRLGVWESLTIACIGEPYLLGMYHWDYATCHVVCILPARGHTVMLSVGVLTYSQPQPAGRSTDPLSANATVAPILACRW